MRGVLVGIPISALIWLSLFGAYRALAGLDVPPAPPDLSGFQTKTEAAAAMQEMQSAIPQPASSVPPSEMTGGSIGSPGTYRPADARQPRITRSRTVTLAADGTATFDWTAQGPLSVPVQVVIGPVFPSTGGVPKCWTVSAGATAATIKCVTETVALVSVAGINIGSVTNSAPAGMQVGVVVLPAS